MSRNNKWRPAASKLTRLASSTTQPPPAKAVPGLSNSVDTHSLPVMPGQGKLWLSLEFLSLRKLFSLLFSNLEYSLQIMEVAALEALLVPANHIVVYEKVTPAFRTTLESPHFGPTTFSPSLNRITHVLRPLLASPDFLKFFIEA